MPNIEEIVAQIRTAIYGKDVRENIALGIEICYEDAVKDGVVRYDETQSLTSTQKNTARTNINAANLDSVITYKGNIPANSNVDNFLVNGMWTVYTTAQLPTNWPSTTIGALIVYATTASNNSGTVQLVLDYNGQMYSRYKRSDTFTSWRKILDNGDIVTDIAPAILPKTMSLKNTPSGNFDVNNLLSPGMYSIASSGNVANWPSLTDGGRLLVFGDTNSNTNRIVQMVIDNAYNIYVRYKSASFGRWYRLGTQETGSIGSTGDCDLHTRNGKFIITSADAGHWPSDKTGTLIVFGDENNATARIIQIAVDYQTNAYIRYKSTGWTSWRPITNHTGQAPTVITVKSSGGNFTTIPAALKYVHDKFEDNPNLRWLIKIDPGTYDISDEVITLINTSSINIQGLFIPPNTTVCGAGKDKTIIRFIYGGTSDLIMSNVSLFNMPYESCLMDCSLIAKNIRYCIHSALNEANMSEKYIDDVTIKCSNVKMEHLGFDSDKTPTYKSPGAFGSGSTNGGKKEFYNCDFIAKYVPWFNHNRKDLTKATEFIFEGCAFINRPVTGGASSSLNLITWKDNPQNLVFLRNCHINRYLSLTIKTSNDDYGDPNNHNGYYVSSDRDLCVLESTVNNSHFDDTYMDCYCEKLIASENITAYTPVSTNAMTSVRKYVSSDPRRGIAISSATEGNICCVKLGGRILLANLTSTSYSVGTKLGWNGTAWVQDNNNPILKVAYSGMCEFV